MQARIMVVVSLTLPYAIAAWLTYCSGLSKSSSSNGRSRTRHEEPIDEFDAATYSLHEKAQVYKLPEHAQNSSAEFFKNVHNSNCIIRLV